MMPANGSGGRRDHRPRGVPYFTDVTAKTVGRPLVMVGAEAMRRKPVRPKQEKR
jgi:hypothetical protein